ncbi:MAG: MBL fold metallo-hydrolase [Candidatus Njordarchaeales archaeon]
MRKERKIVLSDIEIIPIWSDSMGAKSFSIFINTGDVKVLIDAGVSAMQPSFPLDEREKGILLEKALKRIRRFAEKADIITITHYHYDHFKPSLLEIYKSKLILAKNPNEFINESQRKRAEEFFTSLYRYLTNKNLEFTARKKVLEPRNPLDELKVALDKDFGDYNTRRKELLEKGLKWFQRLVVKWNTWKIIPEINLGTTEWRFIDNKRISFGKTTIRFLKPMFHGIEFSRVGWVVPIIIEKEDVKILYTSDLNGPIIEDYANWIISENPDILFLDGPATYMIPYTLNLINFRRSLENISRIIKETETKIIFLDHHVTRDRRFRKRLGEVYRLAKKLRKNVTTFAEFYGEKPLAERI